MNCTGILILCAALIFAAVFWNGSRLSALVFCCIPLLMILWPHPLNLQVFTWVKVFTLCFSMAIFDLAPSPPRINPQGMYRFLSLVLALNIAEAVVSEAANRRWLGAIIGVALIALQLMVKTAGLRNGEREHGVVYDLPWPWIAACTAWNAGFVCTAYPLHASDHMAVLSAPIIAAIWFADPGFWLRARALTLTIHALAVVGVVDMEHRPWLPAIHDALRLEPWFKGCALALILWCALSSVALSSGLTAPDAGNAGRGGGTRDFSLEETYS